MSLLVREARATVSRRVALGGLLALSACKRKAKGNPYAGRWEGKLTNGLSTLGMQFDFAEKAPNELELRATARDLFLSSHPLSEWAIEGSAFRCKLPLVEGDRLYSGFFSGPTFDVEAKDAGEKLHMRQLGRVPQLPYKEAAGGLMTPTNRSVRARVRMLGSSAALKHFHADMLAKMGVGIVGEGTSGAGIFATEDMKLPEPKDGLPFVIALSPAYERIGELAAFPCPLLVVLGEADERFAKLERGTRQVAFDLREALTKKGRKPESFQIRVIPQGDRSLRVRGFGKEYPRLSPQYNDHFRNFLARFDTAV
jgi:hypothetical protein